MPKRPSADLFPQGGVCVIELLSVMEPELVEEGPVRGRLYDDHALQARIIQSSLLPTHGLSHYTVEIAFRFKPFSDVGADFFQLPDGLIHLYLGDVVGKGLPAAMYSALAMGTLRGIHKTGTDTMKVLALLNQRLAQRPIPGRFCSTLYSVFNPATLELNFSNAGISLPLLVSGGECRELGEGGLPSGMFPDAAYQQHVVQLGPGDCVLFASDGLHELRNPEEVEFGVAHLGKAWAQCRQKSASESVDFIFERQRAFSNGNAPHDDITAVVLKVLP